MTRHKIIAFDLGVIDPANKNSIVAGRTRFQFHDSLHRLIREELPGDVARTRTFTHSDGTYGV